MGEFQASLWHSFQMLILEIWTRRFTICIIFCYRGPLKKDIPYFSLYSQKTITYKKF